MIGVTKFRIRKPSLRNTAHISTRNTSGISCARSYRTLRDGSFEGRFPRHFVPGYDRCCPYGTRLQTFRNSIWLEPVAKLLRNVPEGRCDRSLARSAWDSATPKCRPVGNGVIRAGVRTDSMIGVTKFRIRKPSLRNTAHISTRNTSGISCARSYRTLRDGSFEGRFPRHFVPGYDRCCPYGTRLQTFRNSIWLEPVAKCPGGTVRS